jgi:hypothetical protein
MSLVAVEQRVMEQRVVAIFPDPSYASFVAKAQKAKTRKGKDYFVLRVTIPKEIADEIEAGPEDYLVLRAKKAEWYHMVDWTEMENTWNMLPPEIKRGVTLSGLPTPNLPKLLAAPSSQDMSWQLSVVTGTAALTNQTTQMNQP